MGMFSFNDPMLTPQEKHVQKERRLQSILLTIITSLITASIIWGSKTLVTLNTQMAVATNELSRVSSTMYQATDAMHDVADMTNRIDSNGRRIESLEKFKDSTVIRLDRLERRPAAAAVK